MSGISGAETFVYRPRGLQVIELVAKFDDECETRLRLRINFVESFTNMTVYCSKICFRVHNQTGNLYYRGLQKKKKEKGYATGIEQGQSHGLI